MQTGTNKFKEGFSKMKPTWLSEDGIKAYDRFISLPNDTDTDLCLRTREDITLISWETEFAAKVEEQRFQELRFPEKELVSALEAYQKKRLNLDLRVDKIFEHEAFLTVHEDERTDHEDASKQSVMKAVADMKRYRNAEKKVADSIGEAKGWTNPSMETLIGFKTFVEERTAKLRDAYDQAQESYRCLRTIRSFIQKINDSNSLGKSEYSDHRQLINHVAQCVDNSIRHVEEADRIHLCLMEGAKNAIKSVNAEIVATLQIELEFVSKFSLRDSNIHGAFTKSLNLGWRVCVKLLRTHVAEKGHFSVVKYESFYFERVQWFTKKTTVLLNQVLDRANEVNSLVECIKLKLRKKEFLSPNFLEPCSAELDLALMELQKDISNFVSQFQKDILKETEKFDIPKEIPKDEKKYRGIWAKYEEQAREKAPTWVGGLFKICEDFGNKVILKSSVLFIHRLKWHLIILQGVYLHYLMLAKKNIAKNKTPPATEDSLESLKNELMQNAYKLWPSEFGSAPVCPE